jgi:hypothetical protein
MKNLYISTLLCIVFALFHTGCKTVDNSGPIITEPNALKAANWVKERSGFIEAAVQAITHVAVYSSDENTAERARTLEIMHAIAGNVNALIASGKVDSDSIKAALRIDEPYFGPIMDAVANIVQVELSNFSDNGYKDLGVAVLVAVSRGISDGTAQ